MARNISPQEAARRLSQAGFSYADRYRQGTQGKGNEWQAGAAAGTENYEQGVQKALAENRYEEGVSRAGGGRYDEGVRTKGVQNWPTGMQTADRRYMEGIQPFTSLWNAPLSTPRGVSGSPANITRMTENVKRFQEAKQ